MPTIISQKFQVDNLFFYPVKKEPNYFGSWVFIKYEFLNYEALKSLSIKI